MVEKKKETKVKVEDLEIDKKNDQETLKSVKGGAAKKKPAKK